MVPLVVLLTGLPAAGKTTLSEPLSATLGLPSLRLDSVKEAMFDSIGYSTRDWSDFLTIVGKEIAFRILPQIGPCVLDIFMPLAEARERLSPLAEEIIEIHCSIPYEIAWHRFIERAQTGHRHPGHVDGNVSLESYVESLRPQQVDRPFRLGGPVLEIDTGTTIDFTEACEWAKNEVNRITNYVME